MAKKKKKPRKILEYELPETLKKHRGTLILGCDPGSANFGIALVGTDGSKPRVHFSAMLKHPINDLVNVNQAYRMFRKELRDWLEFAPDAVAAERFQTRGPGGPLIEYVSLMLGVLVSTCKVPVKLTIASAWKNAFNRRFDVDLKEIYPTLNVLPHQLDAALIGVYGLEQGLGIKLDYEPEDIIRQVEKTSLIELKRKKRN